MSKLRKLERSIVKANAAKSNMDFTSAWNDYRDKKYVVRNEDGEVLANNTPRNTQKKKQSHFDNKEQYYNMLAWLDSFKNASVVMDDEVEVATEN